MPAIVMPLSCPFLLTFARDSPVRGTSSALKERERLFTIERKETNCVGSENTPYIN